MTLRLFIGWDESEAVAYHVLCNSIIRQASKPVSITPLIRKTLGVERGPLDSTDFARTRFVVPYLSGFIGYSVFMDCDMVVRGDIHDLMAEVFKGDERTEYQRESFPLEPAVWVVKHDYVPKAALKMDGQRQTAYRRKNWSSLVVFNNARCRALTPEYVREAPGLDLHGFAWLRDEQIGSLPLEWNHLVGEGNQCDPERARTLHYTNGGVWHCEFEGEMPWQGEYELATGTRHPRHPKYRHDLPGEANPGANTWSAA